jgi:hypothetical protein
MGALIKKGGAGKSAGTVLPDLLGGGDDGFGVDDVPNLARRFFRRRDEAGRLHSHPARRLTA